MGKRDLLYVPKLEEVTAVRRSHGMSCIEYDTEGHTIRYTLRFGTGHCPMLEITVDGWTYHQEKLSEDTDGSVVAISLGMVHEFFETMGDLEFKWRQKTINDIRTFACGYFG